MTAVMQHLNYCRQMLRQDMNSRVMAAAVSSQKFILPRGGFLLEDESLRAIDESSELRLPFPTIALEYSSARDGDAEVLFAFDHRDRIEAFVCLRLDGVWYDFDSNFWMPKRGYMDRSVSGYLGYPGLVSFDHYDGANHRLDVEDNFAWQRVLLSFLNALTCSNVRIQRSEPRKTGTVKAALPFDAYHLLVIDVPGGWSSGAGTGGHRSPREHLRRGHIRRLADGRRIWVNATVVAAGRGAGAVTKDYVVRDAQGVKP